MTTYKCKACGANLKVREGQNIVVCEYCDTHQSLSVLNDKKPSIKAVVNRDVIALNEKRREIYSVATEKSRYDNIAAVKNAIALFESIPDYMDSVDQVIRCQAKLEKLEHIAEEIRLQKQKEKQVRTERMTKNAKRLGIIAAPIVAVLIIILIVFNTVIVPQNRYTEAIALMDAGKYAEAVRAFESLGDYMDSEEKLKGAYVEAHADIMDWLNFTEFEQIRTWMLANRNCVISIKDNHFVVLKSNGKLEAYGYNSSGQCDVSNWINTIAVSAGEHHTVGLMSNGTVIGTSESNFYGKEANNWTDIIAVSTGLFHTAGLKSDGTVVVAGSGSHDDIESWTDIVAVSAGSGSSVNGYTVGLKSDGTVLIAQQWGIVVTGRDETGRDNVSDWSDIIAISAGNDHTVGLKSDGKVLAVGENEDGRCDVSAWSDIVAISAGDRHTVGLKSDSTVVAVGDNKYNNCDVSNWSDIIAISAGKHYTIGLKNDGTLVSAGAFPFTDKSTISNIKNIRTQ